MGLHRSAFGSGAAFGEHDRDITDNDGAVGGDAQIHPGSSDPAVRQRKRQGGRAKTLVQQQLDPHETMKQLAVCRIVERK